MRYTHCYKLQFSRNAIYLARGKDKGFSSFRNHVIGNVFALVRCCAIRLAESIRGKVPLLQNICHGLFGKENFVREISVVINTFSSKARRIDSALSKNLQMLAGITNCEKKHISSSVTYQTVRTYNKCNPKLAPLGNNLYFQNRKSASFGFASYVVSNTNLYSSRKSYLSLNSMLVFKQYF